MSENIAYGVVGVAVGYLIGLWDSPRLRREWRKAVETWKGIFRGDF